MAILFFVSWLSLVVIWVTVAFLWPWSSLDILLSLTPGRSFYPESYDRPPWTLQTFVWGNRSRSSNTQTSPSDTNDCSKSLFSLILTLSLQIPELLPCDWLIRYFLTSSWTALNFDCLSFHFANSFKLPVSLSCNTSSICNNPAPCGGRPSK